MNRRYFSESHRKYSEACQKEVEEMSKQPFSFEQFEAQVERNQEESLRRAKQFTLKATIESNENNYSAFLENLDGVVATGATIAEIKANLIDAIDDYIETCKEFNCELPEELKEGNFSIEFKMDKTQNQTPWTNRW